MDALRIGLFSSAIVVLVIAVIVFAFIMFKVYKKKKEIMNDQIQIAKELSTKESEQKMINRVDFGKPITELQEILGPTINHEIVEFCINSCIRNDYKNILLVGNVEPYEVIAISNKANVNIIVREREFDLIKYNQMKNNENIIKHNVLIVNDLNENNNFDAIMILNSTNNFDQLFLENEKYLNKKGMFIVANANANKKSVKELIREVEKMEYRYDLLKWYTGFVVIVK